MSTRCAVSGMLFGEGRRAPVTVNGTEVCAWAAGLVADYGVSWTKDLIGDLVADGFQAEFTRRECVGMRVTNSSSFDRTQPIAAVTVEMVQRLWGFFRFQPLIVHVSGIVNKRSLPRRVAGALITNPITQLFQSRPKQLVRAAGLSNSEVILSIHRDMLTLEIQVSFIEAIVDQFFDLERPPFEVLREPDGCGSSHRVLTARYNLADPNSLAILYDDFIDATGFVIRSQNA